MANACRSGCGLPTNEGLGERCRGRSRSSGCPDRKVVGRVCDRRGEKRKHEFVQQLGADRVIDYTTSVVTDEVNDADVVIELAGGDTTIPMLKALREGAFSSAHENCLIFQRFRKQPQTWA